MNAFLTSPTRNLIGGVLFVLTVGALAVAGYMSQGWSSGDALYMVVLTVFTVGYDEVHPIATLPLRAITMGLIVTGCTGMIFVTGALVQFITLSGIQQALGHKYMSRQIDQLRNHVIICGFGRTGTMLARELQAGGAAFVVLERDPDRIEEARGLDYLCLHGDATEEDTLRHAGIERARALATVLPEDAINVYITLTARSLNKTMMIVARGELPSTISKLQYAGATEVVLPAHIGAERIAELILYPEAANACGGAGVLRGRHRPPGERHDRPPRRFDHDRTGGRRGDPRPRQPRRGVARLPGRRLTRPVWRHCYPSPGVTPRPS